MKFHIGIQNANSHTLLTLGLSIINCVFSGLALGHRYYFSAAINAAAAAYGFFFLNHCGFRIFAGKGNIDEQI